MRKIVKKRPQEKTKKWGAGKWKGNAKNDFRKKQPERIKYGKPEE